MFHMHVYSCGTATQFNIRPLRRSRYGIIDRMYEKFPFYRVAVKPLISFKEFKQILIFKCNIILIQKLQIFIPERSFSMMNLLIKDVVVDIPDL